MWRRRAFTGRPGRPFTGRPRLTLRRAFQLMESGKHIEAAQLFEQLARSALDLGLVRRSSHLFLQAARARFLGGQPDMGLALAREGLQVLANARQWDALNRLGNRITGELKDMGYPDQSRELAGWLSSVTQGVPVKAPESKDRRMRLPAFCSQCGAALRPDEVEWIDHQTAECAYCGSIQQVDE